MATPAVPMTIPYDFKARSYQIPFWEAAKTGIKRFILIWPRRNGKDKTAFNFMVMKAVQKVGIYYYLFPSYNQGRKILWDGIDGNGLKFMAHIPKELITNLNSTEMKVTLRNGSIIQIVGVDNVDSIVGTNPIGCVFSEYSLQDPSAWNFIRPILAENGGWALFIYTPRGSNHGKDLYDIAKDQPDVWFVDKLTADDTGYPSKASIDQERRDGMSEDMIQQEFYTSFTLGIEGSYYSKYIQEAYDEDRIARVPWNKNNRVYTAWDLGYGDSTAITFYQFGAGSEVHIIDYYESHGEGLAHYAGVLRDKKYIYADHYAPHDIDNHSFATGCSAKAVGLELGIRFVTLPTLKLRLEDGIEAVRGIFPRCYFDKEKCKPLIKALENYRKEFNETHGVYKNRPLHDKWSHGADSFRYFALAVKLYADNVNNPISDKQSEEWFKKYNPRFE